MLSHHTALQFHGRAHTVWQQLSYQATRPAAPLTFRPQVFRGTRFPYALSDRGAQLVDVLNRPRYPGGWEEIWRSLESVASFDLNRVVQYALLQDNATTVARVGFFLEQHRNVLMLDETHLAGLRHHRPRRPHHLDRSKRGGRLPPDWNLVVPTEVMERSRAEI